MEQTEIFLENRQCPQELCKVQRFANSVEFHKYPDNNLILALQYTYYKMKISKWSLVTANMQPA